MTLISIDSERFFYVCYIVLVSVEKIYQTLKTSCDRTSKFVTKTPLPVLYSTLFFVFENVVKHSSVFDILLFKLFNDS